MKKIDRILTYALLTAVLLGMAYCTTNHFHPSKDYASLNPEELKTEAYSIYKGFISKGVITESTTQDEVHDNPFGVITHPILCGKLKKVREAALTNSVKDYGSSPLNRSYKEAFDYADGLVPLCGYKHFE